MSSTLSFALWAVGYLGVVSFAFYAFVFADREDSTVGRFVNRAIHSVWSLLGKCLGPRSLGVVEFFLDRAYMLFYCVVVFGSWSVIFSYIYRWIDEQDYVSRYHKYVGYAVFAACVTTFRWASTTSPGLITAQNIHRYDHFPYDDIMFVAGRVCPTRNIPRLARSKFDRFKYNENIPRYDHYCGWVHNVIGEENYRWFLLFLCVHVGMCAYGTYVVGYLFYGLILKQHLLDATFFDRYSGEQIKATKWIIFQYLFNTRFCESGLLAIMSVMMVALGVFLIHNAWLTSRGLTFNESIKWDLVKKWHKKEMKRFNNAVQKKKGNASAQDGDATCTASDDATAGDEPFEHDDDIPYYPGPPPVNIYNRGFVENWKEVVFPLSLRRVATKSKKT